MRFSLGRLLAGVTFVAFGCAALANATPLCSAVVATLTVATLFYAVLAAVYRVADSRAFWLGMSIVGWGYFLLVAFLSSGIPFGDAAELPFVTSKLLYALAEALPQDRPENIPAWIPASAQATLASGATPASFEIYTADNPPPANLTIPGGLVPTSLSSAPDFQEFYGIGECLWSLLLGSIGGLVARHLYATRERRAPS